MSVRERKGREGEGIRDCYSCKCVEVRGQLGSQFSPSTLFLIKKIIYMYRQFACMYVHVPGTCLVPLEARRESWNSRIGVRDYCEPPCRC